MNFAQVQLSDHFSLAEATVSATAAAHTIENIPSSHTIQVMKQAAFCLERVRAALGNLPLHVNSWYRCDDLNEVLGSKPTSQHLKGEAIDFVCPEFGAPVSVCKKLVELKDLIRFDQLILEGTWVHISFAISTGKPRGEVLSLLRNNSYTTGLTDKQGHPL